MAPKTHVVLGEKPSFEATESGNIYPGRTPEDVACDLANIHSEIKAKMGQVLGSYALNPNNGNGQNLYIVVDYPEIHFDDGDCGG
jgi:hypothetical protein